MYFAGNYMVIMNDLQVSYGYIAGILPVITSNLQVNYR